MLSSWPSRHVPWPVADVRIPNAILILIGRCSFGPGVPGQSAQLLLLEGIGYVWLFFRASLHDLENLFKVQALPNQVLKCDLTLANVDMWDTSTDLRLNAAEAWRVTDSESQTQTLCLTHSVRSVVGGPGLALTTVCQMTLSALSILLNLVCWRPLIDDAEPATTAQIAWAVVVAFAQIEWTAAVALN